MFPLDLPRTHCVCVCVCVCVCDLTQFGCEDFNQYSAFSFVCVCVCVCVLQNTISLNIQ